MTTIDAAVGVHGLTFMAFNTKSQRTRRRVEDRSGATSRARWGFRAITRQLEIAGSTFLISSLMRSPFGSPLASKVVNGGRNL